MMNTTVVGKLYGGKAYDWVDKKHEDQDRSLFRGRIGYRNPETGDFAFMDAVCFKDFGSKGGLVGFLDEHFSADGKDDKTGYPVVLTGYVRPAKKTMEVELKAKKSGTTKTIPNVPYETFEFVILSASFTPSSEARNTGRSVETEDDFDDIEDEDEFEVVGDDENVEEDVQEDDQEFEEETEEVEEKPKRVRKTAPAKTAKSTQKGKTQTAGRKAQNQAKKEVASTNEENGDFFDE